MNVNNLPTKELIRTAGKPGKKNDAALTANTVIKSILYMLMNMTILKNLNDYSQLRVN